MHRDPPISKQPRMHDGKQPHAFASNGSKTVKPGSQIYTELNKNIFVI